MSLAVAFMDTSRLFRDPSGNPLPLAFSVVDLSSGNIWSPVAGKFVTPPATDALQPLNSIPGSNHGGLYVGYNAKIPSATTGNQYAVMIHPAAGGAPVLNPFPVQPAPFSGAQPTPVMALSL